MANINWYHMMSFNICNYVYKYSKFIVIVESAITQYLVNKRTMNNTLYTYISFRYCTLYTIYYHKFWYYFRTHCVVTMIFTCYLPALFRQTIVSKSDTEIHEALFTIHNERDIYIFNCRCVPGWRHFDTLFSYPLSYF